MNEEEDSGGVGGSREWGMNMIEKRCMHVLNSQKNN